MSDVFYEMSKVIKPVINYTVLQIFLISSLNLTLVVAFCTVVGNISHTFTPHTLGLFKCSQSLGNNRTLLIPNANYIPLACIRARDCSC